MIDDRPKFDVSRRIVALFIEQDEKCAELYSLFAGRYPELREFWETLAQDEKLDAESLRRISEKMESGDITFVESRTKTYTLRSFISYLNGVIDRFVQKPMPVAAALTIALDIESSNIGKKIYDHFHPRSPDAGRFLDDLRTDPNIRIGRLQEMLKRHRESGPTHPAAGRE